MPARAASSSRKPATTSVPRPPTWTPERSTLETHARPLGDVERDGGERLLGRKGAKPVARSAVLAKRREERIAERLTRSVDLRLRAAGGDLERQVEARVAGEDAKEVVERRQAGGYGRVARSVHGQPRHQLGIHASTLSICAPSDLSRSSTRSYPRSIQRMFPIRERPSAHSAAISIAQPARTSGLSIRWPYS